MQYCFIRSRWRYVLRLSAFTTTRLLCFINQCQPKQCTYCNTNCIPINSLPQSPSPSLATTSDFKGARCFLTITQIIAGSTASYAWMIRFLKPTIFLAFSSVKSGKCLSNLFTASPIIPNCLSTALCVFKSLRYSLKSVRGSTKASIKSISRKISNKYFLY